VGCCIRLLSHGVGRAQLGGQWHSVSWWLVFAPLLLGQAAHIGLMLHRLLTTVRALAQLGEDRPGDSTKSTTLGRCRSSKLLLGCHHERHALPATLLCWCPFKAWLSHAKGASRLRQDSDRWGPPGFTASGT
jgi:hypothetical protein